MGTDVFRPFHTSSVLCLTMIAASVLHRLGRFTLFRSTYDVGLLFL